MLRQIVATTYVVDQDKILMIFHRKLNKWLPPGGHVDPNEAPSEAAIREVFEETGYDIELVSDEKVWVQRWNAGSLPRPYMCLLEEIPVHNGSPAHQHIDFIYLGRLVGGDAKINEREVQSMRWFTLEEVDALQSDVEIFEETQQVIRKILEQEAFKYA
ncbi:MAG: NUDIX hydrolase [Parachlamydiaceae bacterium]|nr:NUDIX hydrolase [Parachlamydiaceae bacterium]